MKIIAFTGMPFSGKTEAIQIARENNLDVIRMGDMVWEEVKKRNLKINDKNVGLVANEMREKYGKQIWAIKTFEKIIIKILPNKIILIDGIRSCEEVDYFKNVLGTKFILIAIISSDNLRYQRALTRMRRDDNNTLIKIMNRDKREINWGIKEVINKADIIVSNNGSLLEFKLKIEKIINNLLKTIN